MDVQAPPYPGESHTTRTYRLWGGTQVTETQVGGLNVTKHKTCMLYTMSLKFGITVVSPF